MSFEVVVTNNFKKEAKPLAKKYRSLRTDVAQLVAILENNPAQGVALGKDCYKVRMAISSKGRGKSGGSRIITCVKVVEQTVFLLSIYDKSEQENVSDRELDALLALAGFS